MSNTIKIGNSNITAFKVGSSDVDKIYLGSTLLYSSGPFVQKNYMRFRALGTGTFGFYAHGSYSGNTPSYSLDSGRTWVELENGTNTPTIYIGQTVFWKMSEPTIVVDKGIGSFSATTEFEVEGNIMSMQYGDNFENQTSLAGKRHAFQGLFSGCTNLVNAEYLELPATTLEYWCYTNLFRRTGIRKAPVLPATTLAEGCYINMFSVCPNLTEAPALPALLLVKDCYKQMFQSATTLNFVNASFTTTPGTAYTQNWLASVKSTGTFIKNPSATWTTRGTNGVPNGWTIYTSVPQYRWEPSGYVCVGNDKYQNNIKQVSTDGGSTWTNVSPVQYSATTLIEANSPDCIFSNIKWAAIYGSGSTSAACDSTSAISSGDISLANLLSVEIGDCVTEIGNSAFKNCSSVASVEIGSGVTSIGDEAFEYCTGLQSITIKAVTPPKLGTYGVSSTNDCPIYVPAESVSNYQRIWSGVLSSRFQAIPNS